MKIKEESMQQRSSSTFLFRESSQHVEQPDKHVVSAASVNCFKNRLQKMQNKDESTFCQRLTNRL